ncbi:MAG TPA: sodium/proton-translocating pyrophosphatase [Polyangiaceae bacterium]
MTELGFIVALELAGFVLSLTMARAAGERDVGASVYRVVSAVERALAAFLARERVAIAAATLLAVVAVVVAQSSFGRPQHALFVAGGAVVGAVLCTTSAALFAAVTARAAGAAHASARLGFNAALGVALRAGGGVGIGASTASTLGALAVFGVTFFASGGRAAGAPSTSLVAPCLVTAGYALGAVLAALVLARAGSAYLVGAEAGRSTFEATGDANDPRNPALVAGLVGNHAGGGLSHGALLFALSAVATAAVLQTARSASAHAEDCLEAAALPLVVRSFGMIGCAAGVLAARADETHGQELALVRGLASAFVIALFGIVGASYWLAPNDFWFFATAGALGLVGGALPSAASWSLGDRARKPVRDAVDALRTGPSAGFGASVGHALERALAPLVIVVTLSTVAGALGERALPGDGARRAISVFTLSLLAVCPYALAVLGVAAVARSARSVTALAKLDAESAWRLQRLDDIGLTAASPARALLFTASAVAPLPAVAGVLLGGDTLGAGLPVALVAASLAAVVALGGAGNWARGAARAADEVRLEVARQVPAPDPGAEGHTPSYRACEELTQRVASSGVLSGALGAASLLVLLGIGLGLVYRVGGSRLAAAAFSTFVATAAVTALGAALAVDGARTVHGNARRLARLERETAGPAAPIPEDVLANVLGSAAGPGACFQALLLASFALAIFLTLTTNP